MSQPRNIITNLAQLRRQIAALRRQKKRIVLTQGSFDMVHIGHARYCEAAKKHGDILIVGVDSDEKVRARKGPDRPVVPQEERLEMLTYLRSVDLVVLKQQGAAKHALIKAVNPDVLVTTHENFQAKNDSELMELKKICGQVVVLEPMATTSTSAKIRRLQIGMAKQISQTLSHKLTQTIEEVLRELRGE